MIYLIYTQFIYIYRVEIERLVECPKLYKINTQMSYFLSIDVVYTNKILQILSNILKTF